MGRIEPPRPPTRQKITWNPNRENVSVLHRTKKGGVQKRKVTAVGHQIKIQTDVKDVSETLQKIEHDLTNQTLQRKEQDVTTLYIRYGFKDHNSHKTEKSIMEFLRTLKPLAITKWRITVDPNHVRKGVGKYGFVKFSSSSTAHYAKLHIEQNFNAYVDIARGSQRNKKNSNTSSPVGYRPQNVNFLPAGVARAALGPIPKFTEKEESIIFHAVKNSQNFRTRKIKLNEKGRREIYIGSEVRQKIKQSPDNLIFDCPTVSMNHAVILLEKNGLKNKYLLQDLKSTNGTLINDIKTENGRRYLLKNGDVIQFGRKNQDGRKLSPPIIARVEIIDKEFRPVIIDGCNICHEAQKTADDAENNKFYVKGLKLAYDCFKDKGYEDNQINIIMKHIPEALRTNDFNRVIGEFQDKRILTFAPSRHSGPYGLVKSDDDLFILNIAKQFNAVVLSRDHYRKEKWKHPEYDDIISYRVLQPTFMREKCILPDDPLGPDGPTIKTFLELND